MLTEKGKRKVERLFNFYIQMADFFSFKRSIPKYPAPELGCVYAAEMSDDTVKIGVTRNLDKRLKGIRHAVYLDVLRVHNTILAPLDFMRIIERRCQDAFIDRHVRGEYFAITFEEACAELDRHAEEIADVFKTADENFLNELIYYEELKKRHFSKYNVINTVVKPSDRNNQTPVHREIQSNDACVYVALLSNGNVKIGYSKDVNKRLSNLKSQYKLSVEKIHSTPFMSSKVARLIEKICYKIFSSSKVDGEFFSVKFEEARATVDSFVTFAAKLIESKSP